MRNLVLALALAVAAEAAALACSCAFPSDLSEARMHARGTVRRATAIVEADVLTSYDARRQRGEQVRVRRVLFGRAPRSFEVARGGQPSSAACELELNAGERRILILYPATGKLKGRYGVHSLCSDALLSPRYLAVTLEEARWRR